MCHTSLSQTSRGERRYFRDKKSKSGEKGGERKSVRVLGTEIETNTIVKWGGSWVSQNPLSASLDNEK
jgi:hypothetical protein